MKLNPLNRRDQRVLSWLATSLLAVVLASGCGARLNQFKSFSEAGVVYSAALVELTDAAGTAAIDADSLILEKTRRARGQGGRIASIQEQNAQMEERLAVLGDIKRHTLLLKAYFGALSALAGSTIGSQIASDTSGIVTQLGKLNPRIANGKIGGATISSLAEPVTGLIVKGIQQAALERELKTNAETIANELALQEAAVNLIAQIWKTDKLITMKHQRSLNARQYARGVALPSNWAAQRRASLTASSSIALADSAVSAATRLKTTFVALVENRLTAEDIPLLLNDINEVVTLLELVRGSGSSA